MKAKEIRYELDPLGLVKLNTYLVANGAETYDSGITVCRSDELLAICYDADSGILLKRGTLASIEGWVKSASEKLSSYSEAQAEGPAAPFMASLRDAAGIARQMIADMTIVSFPATAGSLEALNYLVAHTHEKAVEQFLGKLQSLEPVHRL